VCITFRENGKIATTVVFSECIVKYIFNIDTVRKLIFHRSNEIYIKDRIIPRESNRFFSLRRDGGVRITSGNGFMSIEANIREDSRKL